MTWNPDFAERLPMFEPLRAAARELRTPYWPGCDDFNRIIQSQRQPILTASGRPLRFVEQQLRQPAFEDKYEPRIFRRGEAQFRSCNWHDLLNALVWLTFPRAKAALNRRHYQELVRQRESGAPNRGPAQDALTLFDEGGVIVAVAEPALGALLRDFEWKELFWRRRAEVVRSMRFCLFGHALYEKALAPFVGVTGRGVILEVADGFLAMPLAQQLAELDARLAGHIDDPARLSATRELAPVPVLGVPGWCADNEREEYYDDPGYFRPPPPR
jgi:Protein of unknown function (DUF3025)